MICEKLEIHFQKLIRNNLNGFYLLLSGFSFFLCCIKIFTLSLLEAGGRNLGDGDGEKISTFNDFFYSH